MQRVALLAIASLLVLPTPASARTWHILPDGTGDAPTIAAGLDSSAAGDTVLVAAGTYTHTVARSFDFPVPPETVTLTAAGFLKAGVTLHAEDGPDVTTIAVPGAPNVHVVVAANTPGTAESRVVGFRFEGLSGGAAVLAREMHRDWWIRVEDCIVNNVAGGEQAGGFWSVRAGNTRIVDCSFSDVTGGPTFTTRGSVGIAEVPIGATHRMIVEGCTFFGSGGVNVRQGTESVDLLDCTFEAGFQGAGIFSDAVHTTVEDCTFSECASYPVYMIGTQISSGVVRRCTFLDGAGDPQLGTGAISAVYVVTVIVEDCRFERCNGATGAVSIRDPWAAADNPWTSVRNNVFVDITSGSWGALRLEDLRGEVSNNTFVRCQDDTPIAPGSAIYVYPLSEPGPAMSVLDIHDNIFAECGGSAALGIAAPGRVLERCNDYWANADGDVDGIPMHWTSFGQDPLFCDTAADDFTIQSDSPCAPPGVTGCGLVGALPVGCGPVAVEDWTWGRIKAAHR